MYKTSNNKNVSAHIKQEMTEHLAGMMSLSQPINDNMSAEQKEFKWFKLAAEQGNAIAQLNLGRCYRDGIGVVKNEKEEFKWFKLAAEQRDAIAQLNLDVAIEMVSVSRRIKKSILSGSSWLQYKGMQKHKQSLDIAMREVLVFRKIMLKQSSGTR